MVLVAVGDNDGSKAMLDLLNEWDIRDDKVDSEHFLFGKLEAGVDEEEVIAIFDESCILTDLADPADGDDADGFVGQCREVPLRRDLIGSRWAWLGRVLPDPRGLTRGFAEAFESPLRLIAAARVDATRPL